VLTFGLSNLVWSGVDCVCREAQSPAFANLNTLRSEMSPLDPVRPLDHANARAAERGNRALVKAAVLNPCSGCVIDRKPVRRQYRAPAGHTVEDLPVGVRKAPVWKRKMPLTFPAREEHAGHAMMVAQRGECGRYRSTRASACRSCGPIVM